MEDFVKIFDSILTLLVSFPVTILLIFLSPERVFGIQEGALISSPGGTFVVSFIVYYLAHSTQLSINYPTVDIPSAPSKDFFVRVIVLFSFLLLVQYLVISIPSVLPVAPTEPLRTVKALSYPISAAMTIYGVTYLICIVFPLQFRAHALTIQERLDPIWRTISKQYGTPRILADENAKFFAILSGSLAYAVAIFNIVRVLFKLTPKRAIFVTGLVLIASILLMILIMWVVFERYDKLMKKLISQKEKIPGEQETDIAGRDRHQEEKNDR